MIIGDCIPLIDASFPSSPSLSWFTSYKFSTLQEQLDSEKEIIGNINNLMNQIYEKLNLSVLSGEYIEKDGVSVLDFIKTLTEKIENVPLAISLTTNPTLSRKLEQIFLDSFINPLKISFRDYKILISQIMSKLRNAEVENLFDDNKFKISTPFIFIWYNNLTWVFQTNTVIAKIDHNLAYSKQMLGNLVTAKEGLKRTIKLETKYKEILIDKCNFLMKKILYRFSSEKKNVSYTWDIQEQVLEHDDIETKYFKQFDVLTRSHYDIDNSHDSKVHKDKMDEIAEKERQRTELKMIDFHTAIRCYKDDEKNFSRVRNLVTEYKTRYEKNIKNSELTLFDRNAMFVSRNYMINNEFSLLIELEGTRTKDVNRYIEEIEEVQSRTRVRNYFPFEKACLYYARKISELVKQDFTQAHSEAQTLLKKLDSKLDKAWNCYDWCKTINFNAFQLNYEECKIKYMDEDIDYDLFLASSFVLPVYYERTKIELKELSRKLQMYRTLIEVDENIKIEKDAILEFKRSLEGTDKRYVEILTIFSAIVLFTSASIQIFSKGDVTFNGGIRFMLCFSYCIALFVFLVWWVIHANEKQTSFKTWIFLALLAGSTFTALVFMYQTK